MLHQENFFENEECTKEDQRLINSNHGFTCIQEKITGFKDEEYETQSQNCMKIINTRKWQIMLTSEDCTIKQHCQGWQVRKKCSLSLCIAPTNLSCYIFFKIYPKSTQAAEGKSQLFLRISDSNVNSQKMADVEPATTTNAEILCNREDLNDLFSENDKQEEDNDGRIVLKDYLKLLSTEQAKINFILMMLSKAVNEHKVFVICGTFPVLRKPLGKRGWIEKRYIRRMISMSPEMSAGFQKLTPLLSGMLKCLICLQLV